MPSILATERFVICPWRSDETDRLGAIYHDPEMYRSMSGNPPAAASSVAAMMVPVKRRYAQRPGMGMFAAVAAASGFPIGSALIRPLEEGPEIEIGYHIAKPEWRKGYATEIARGMVRYAFTRFDHDAVYGGGVPDNTGSRTALERAGLREIDRGSYCGLDALLLRITRAERAASTRAACDEVDRRAQPWKGRVPPGRGVARGFNPERTDGQR